MLKVSVLTGLALLTAWVYGQETNETPFVEEIVSGVIAEVDAGETIVEGVYLHAGLDVRFRHLFRGPSMDCVLYRYPFADNLFDEWSTDDVAFLPFIPEVDALYIRECTLMDNGPATIYTTAIIENPLF